MNRNALLTAAVASSLAVLATDGALAAPTPPAAEAAPTPAPDHVMKYAMPGIEGEHTLDLSTLPPAIRMDLLKTAARDYLRNRVNSAAQRHQRDEKVKAWAAYHEANKADALQTAVPKPEGDEPTAPDLLAVLNKGVADLIAGNVRKQSDEPKARAKKDPLVQMVTKAVVREVYEARKATDSGYTYVKAAAEVGADGVAYLNTLIDAKVAAGADRTALEKARDTKYVNPAKLMLGLTETKASKELPSIL